MQMRNANAQCKCTMQMRKRLCAMQMPNANAQAPMRNVNIAQVLMRKFICFSVLIATQDEGGKKL
jgi:hypothetical protein